LIHPLTSALNIYAANLGPVGGSLKTIDFESDEPFGVNQLGAFTWKDLLDLDACTECGRCTDACPAHSVGKALSPRDLILELRDHMHHEGVTKGKEDDEGLSARLPALAPETLWQCTTCAACVEACPVSIEQLPKIVDLRRFQVMEEAAVPDSIQAAMTSLETRGHPFTGSRYSRLDWAEGLNVPVLSEAQSDPDVLLWVGCGGALVERNQKSTRALATLLERAGVSYAILGREEKCTGDPARRMGNEFLFEQLAQENVDLMTKHKVKKVVTSCPHCFNTFRNEYPRMGAKFEVVHHTEFLGKLIESGKLKMKPGDLRKIALHDPCYLSRHNGITDAPRELLRSASGTKLIEAERSGKESFCCGGGGGMSFVDEPAGQRVNQERSREMLETGADTVAVACPFCTTMMEDGVNAQKGDRQVEVKELSELVLEASEEV
jgi:Fe-S oxidoreductase